MSDVKVKIKLKGGAAMGFLRNGAFGDTDMAGSGGSMIPRPKGGMRDAHQDKKKLDAKAKSFAGARVQGKAAAFRLPSSRNS